MCSTYRKSAPDFKGPSPGATRRQAGTFRTIIVQLRHEDSTLNPPLSAVPAWRKTLYAVAAGEILAIAGFNTSTPITPFFLQELGVTEPGRLKLLSGLVQALPSVSLVVFSPIWGSIADAYGRKPMLLRAMFGGTAVMLLMGLVTAPWQLVVLKTIQGCLTGTVAAATIMVASLAPPQETGYALGLLQMAIFLGASLGPLIGGFVADAFGLRVNFFATSLLLLAAGVVVARFAQDNFRPPAHRKSILSSLVPDFRPLARSRALWSLMAVIAADQVAGSITSPFLPLFIQQLSSTAVRVGSMTGVVIGLSAVASALAAVIVGRFSYRLGYRRVLIVCMSGAALFIIPQAFVRTPVQLLLLRIVSAFFVGGNLPSVNALIAQRVQPGRQGSIYGISSAIASASNALGPLIGASIALAGDFGTVFLTTAGIMAAAGLSIGVFVRGARAAAPGPGGPSSGPAID
ncbi:MAG TPA: MFS transporter [Spirochaetia bacterium]|nr:MFS transporter [Spirochaetia bacterium]